MSKHKKHKSIVGTAFAMAVAMAASLSSESAHAVTECSALVARVFTDDAGGAWIELDSGLNGTVPGTNAGARNYLGLATAALAVSKQLTLRFTASGVPCNASGNMPAYGARTDMIGIYINRNALY